MRQACFSALLLLGLCSCALLGLCSCALLGLGDTRRYEVFFTEGSSRLDEPARATVAAAARVARRHPNATVTVSGYAGPGSTPAAADRVSANRAQAVAEALVADGVSGGRLRAESEGPTPSPPHSGEESRRVEIVISE